MYCTMSIRLVADQPEDGLAGRLNGGITSLNSPPREAKDKLTEEPEVHMSFKNGHSELVFPHLEVDLIIDIMKEINHILFTRKLNAPKLEVEPPHSHTAADDMWLPKRIQKIFGAAKLQCSPPKFGANSMDNKNCSPTNGLLMPLPNKMKIPPDKVEQSPTTLGGVAVRPGVQPSNEELSESPSLPYHCSKAAEKRKRHDPEEPVNHNDAAPSDPQAFRRSSCDSDRTTESMASPSQRQLPPQTVRTSNWIAAHGQSSPSAADSVFLTPPTVDIFSTPQAPSMLLSRQSSTTSEHRRGHGVLSVATPFIDESPSFLLPSGGGGRIASLATPAITPTGSSTKGPVNESVSQNSRSAEETETPGCRRKLDLTNRTSSIDSERSSNSSRIEAYKYDIPNVFDGNCYICGQSFQTEPLLRKHMLSHATNRKAFKCKICKKESQTRGELQLHMQEHNDRYCRHCKNIFSTPAYYVQHNCSRPFPCLVCSKQFKLKAQLEEHVLVEHRATLSSMTGQAVAAPVLSRTASESCSSTGAPSNRQSLDVPHKAIRLSTDGKDVDVSEYPCDECSKVFPTPAWLNYHHTFSHQKPDSARSGRVGCPVCGGDFNRSNLTQHIMKAHEKQWHITCSICKKLFTTDVYLKRHMDKSHNSTNTVGRDKSKSGPGTSPVKSPTKSTTKRVAKAKAVTSPRKAKQDKSKKARKPGQKAAKSAVKGGKADKKPTAKPRSPVKAIPKNKVKKSPAKAAAAKKKMKTTVVISGRKRSAPVKSGTPKSTKKRKTGEGHADTKKSRPSSPKKKLLIVKLKKRK